MICRTFIVFFHLRGSGRCFRQDDIWQREEGRPHPDPYMLQGDMTADRQADRQQQGGRANLEESI